MRTIMAGLAEFERDLIRERVKSGLAAAKARGVSLGRQHGQRPSDKKAKKVLSLHAEGLSYRRISGINEAVSPHWLRHAHGSHAIERGASLPEVQATWQPFGKLPTLHAPV